MNIDENKEHYVISSGNGYSKFIVKIQGNERIISYLVQDKTVLKFKDLIIDDSSFIRTINNNKYHFKNGILILKERKLYLRKISKTKKHFTPKLDKFLTMDLETRSINGTMEVFAVSIYDGNNISFFYLEDYKDSEDLLVNSISSLMVRKYHGYCVYLHNLSHFDGIFMLRVLSSLSPNNKIIIRDHDIIEIKFSWKNYYIYFRDSFLLLPSSLRKLAVAFDVEDKGVFPYNFVQLQNLNYEGSVPDFKYFSNLTEIQYKEYCKQFKYTPWNMKLETIKYCIQDCRTLYLVLSKFFEQNFLDTRVNGSKYQSLSALALANFRTHFLKDDTFIPNIRGEVFDFVRESYTGGAVDAYLPYGKKVYCYDVNSLYPYIMSSNPMPVGNPTLLEFDNTQIKNIIEDKNKISFVEVEVNCPDNIKVPLLLHRINDKTVAPTGSWKGIYTSMEINRAIDLGYSFKYYRCIYFNSEIIFKEYVEFYYRMKQNSDKNSVGYMISKLLLNSLYGRFGMSPYLDKHVIIDSSELNKLSEIATIKDIIPLSGGKDLLSYSLDDSSEINLSEINRNSLTSISIAAAITAYSRVYMSNFKNRDDHILYYSDTDSLVVDKPLPDKYVGPELGQFKLEQGGKGDPNEKVYI